MAPMETPPTSIGLDRIGPWLQQGAAIVTRDLPIHVIAGFLWIVASAATQAAAAGLTHSFLPGASLALVLFALLPGPLAAGLFRMSEESFRSGHARLGAMAEGFGAVYPHAMLATLLVSLFTGVGFLFCVLPAFLVWAIYSLTYARLVAGSPTFWDAMEDSRRVVTPHLWTVTLFQLVLAGVNLLGACACGVGLAFTLPLTVAANTACAREIAAAAVTTGKETPHEF